MYVLDLCKYWITNIAVRTVRSLHWWCSLRKYLIMSKTIYLTPYVNPQPFVSLCYWFPFKLQTFNIFSFLDKAFFLTIMHLHLKKFFFNCSPVSPYTNVAPLSIVLIVSLIKEAFEDWVSSTSLWFTD